MVNKSVTTVSLHNPRSSKVLLQTHVGVRDLENNLGGRIRDKIALSGDSINIMLELNDIFFEFELPIQMGRGLV